MYYLNLPALPTLPWLSSPRPMSTNEDEYRAGDEVVYYNEGARRNFEATVTRVHSNGDVTLDVEEKRVSSKDLADVLKPRGKPFKMLNSQVSGEINQTAESQNSVVKLCHHFVTFCQTHAAALFDHGIVQDQHEELLHHLVDAIFDAVFQKPHHTSGPEPVGRVAIYWFSSETFTLAASRQNHPDTGRTRLDSLDSVTIQNMTFPGFLKAMQAGDLLLRNADLIAKDVVPNAANNKELMFVAISRHDMPCALVEVGGFSGTSFTEQDLRFVSFLCRGVIGGFGMQRSPGQPMLECLKVPPVQHRETDHFLLEAAQALLPSTAITVSIWAYDEGTATLLSSRPHVNLTYSHDSEHMLDVFHELAHCDGLVFQTKENIHHYHKASSKSLNTEETGSKLMLGFIEQRCIWPDNVVDGLGHARVFMPVKICDTLKFFLSFSSKKDLGANEVNRCLDVGIGVVQSFTLLCYLAKLWRIQARMKMPEIKDLVKQIKEGHVVALTGAGFSVPLGLPNWSTLLYRIAAEAVDSGRLKPEMQAYLEASIKKNTAEAFDEVAQILEDILGSDMQALIKKNLQMSSQMPRLMVRRRNWLLGIPFCAVLTTNYDMVLEGCTPGCPQAADTYAQILRDDVKRPDFMSMLIYAQVPPILKIHGCVERGNIVFTREGYRQLEFKRPEYPLFMKSLFASRTVLSLGHSGVDAYLNHYRSEVLAMLTPSTLDLPPLAYNLMPQDPAKAAFSRAHDSLQYLSWDVEKESFEGFDLVLEHLYQLTHPRALFKRLLTGRRILLFEPEGIWPQNLETRELWSTKKLSDLLRLCRPSVSIYSVSDLASMKEEMEGAFKKLRAYDIVLAIFDHQTIDLLDWNRKSDFYTPVAIITSTQYNSSARITGIRLSSAIKHLATFEQVVAFLYQFFQDLSMELKSQLGGEDTIFNFV